MVFAKTILTHRAGGLRLSTSTEGTSSIRKAVLMRCAVRDGPRLFLQVREDASTIHKMLPMSPWPIQIPNVFINIECVYVIHKSDKPMLS